MFSRQNDFPRIEQILVSFLIVVGSVLFYSDLSAQTVSIDPKAQIFTKQNVGSLCVDGKVDRYLLAEKIVQTVNLKASVRLRATGTGEKGGKKSNIETYVYDLQPFGDNVPSADPELAAAIDLQSGIRAQFQNWAISNVQMRNPLFRIEPRVVPLTFLTTYYNSKGSIEITCPSQHAARPSGGSQRGGVLGDGNTPRRSNFKSRVLVRKSVSDIAIPRSKLKKANAALISYRWDEQNDFRSYTIDGLVGLVISGTGADRAARLRHAKQVGSDLPLYWLKVTPYLYHKRFNRTPNSKAARDINIVEPGVAGSLTWVGPNGNLSFDLTGSGSWVDDKGQGSSYYNTALAFSPSVQIGNTILFNAPLFRGPFGFRPNLTFHASEFFVDKVGTDPTLKGRDSFSSFGYDAELKIFLIKGGAFLTNIEGRLAYKQRKNTNGVVDAERFEAGLSFMPFGTKNITVDLEHVDGRNLKTRQQEDYWLASLGVRF